MSRLCRLRTKTHGEDGQWAYEEITKLREQVAAQAAVIESLRDALSVVMWFVPNHPTVHENKRRFDILKAALAIPTDSTQILDEVRRAERERCAKVCESHPDPEYTAVHFECASLIRAME